MQLSVWVPVCVIVLFVAGCRCLRSKLQPKLPHNVDTAHSNEVQLGHVLRRIDHLSLHLRNATDADVDVAHYLLQQTICPLHLIVGQQTPYFSANQRHRALVMSSRQLEAVLFRYATRQGIFICIFSNVPNELELLRIARRMWVSRGVLRIYYIIPNQGAGLFFDPFPKSGKNYGAMVKLIDGRFEDMFSNLKGYPLRIYIFDSVYSTVFGDEGTKKITSIRGADCRVAKELSKKMNFTMDLQWPDDEFFGARLENGTYNGAIGRLIRYEADITFTGFFVKDYLTRDIDFSVAVYMDDLCCYVMKAKRVPQSILPLFAVAVDIWCAFLVVGLISPFVWMVFRIANLSIGHRTDEQSSSHLSVQHARERLEHGIQLQFMRIYIDTWVLWVRVNLMRYPPFNSERIFIASLCLVSVIFGAIFESSLATVYIRPLYYKDINTMQELADSNFHIFIKHAAMKDDLFYGYSSAVYQNLNRKLLLVAEMEERVINIMSKRGGFAAVTRGSSLMLHDIRYLITKKIHKIPECPKNYHIAFLFPSQSPLEEPVNVLLLRFVQAGLIEHWIEEMKHKAKISIHNFPDYFAELGDKWKVLTLRDLQLPFYVLACGSVLSTLSILGEFVMRYKLLNVFQMLKATKIRIKSPRHF